MLTRRVIVFLCCLMSSTVWAIEKLQLTVADWQGVEENHPLKLQNLAVDIHYTQRGLGFTATVDEIKLAEPINKLTRLELNCSEVQFNLQNISCQKGQLSFTQKDLGHQIIDFSIEANTQQQHYYIVTSGLTIASAKVALTLTLDKQQWRLETKAKQVDMTQLSAFIEAYLTTDQQMALQQWQHAGKINVKLDAHGDNNQLDKVEITTKINQLEVSDEAGQIVTEGVNSHLTIKLQRQTAYWQWQTMFYSGQGQAYANPVFLDLTAAPITIKAEGTWEQTTNKLTVSSSEIYHHNIGQAEIKLTIMGQQLERLKINIEKTALAPLYQHWIQPFTVGTATDNLTIKGQASLHYEQEKSGFEIQVGLENVSAQDGLSRFTVEGASGELAWTTLDKTLPINLVWHQATLYSVPIGFSSLAAQTEKSGLSLVKPWQIAILDGELKIKDFALNQDELAGTTWNFQGLLTPISMSKLSQYLGWPKLSGKLSGVIPNVAYQAQEIKVDGALMIKLFKGTTIIHDLRLTKPFGPIPQLYSNIDLLGFDLETMTETFDFGKITGTLEGKVQNLRLANWQPVAFNAYLNTPEKDKIRHRISQQAVNNLSEIGGGASGVLSRSALRFFEDFSYQRLGLSCKLRNDVCEMGGIEDAEQGYYIVKGGGLPPRINVVGYTRLVDWPELFSRLKAVSNSSGPLME